MDEPVLNNKKLKYMSLYDKCKIDFSSYLHKHKHSLRLLVDNTTLKKMFASEYISEQKQKNKNDNCTLTPLPYKSNKNLKSKREKDELMKLQRNAVVMRMIEYTQKMNNNDIKYKYIHCTKYILQIQKVIRGYVVRKAIKDIKMIQSQIESFIAHIMMFCIRRKKESDSAVQHVQQETENYEKDRFFIESIITEHSLEDEKYKVFKTYENKENITKDFIKNNSNDIRPISNDCNNGIDSKEISRLLLNQTKMTIKRASQYDIDNNTKSLFENNKNISKNGSENNNRTEIDKNYNESKHSNEIKNESNVNAEIIEAKSEQKEDKKENEGTFISKTKTISHSLKKSSMIKNSNLTDNNDYNTLYANLKQKSSKLNIESNKEIDNETEHKVISTVIINEDDKEINLSEFTEKNSLLIDKFSCFIQQKPNTLNSENSFLSSQNLLHKVILIQTKFRLYLNRKSDRKQISLRARKTFTIPIRAKNQIFKTTKQSSIRSIFSTQK